MSSTRASRIPRSSNSARVAATIACSRDARRPRRLAAAAEEPWVVEAIELL
jgi:hypothetical protein